MTHRGAHTRGRSFLLDVYETANYFGEGMPIPVEDWCARYCKGNLNSARARWDRFLHNLRHDTYGFGFGFEVVKDTGAPKNNTAALVLAKGSEAKAISALDRMAAERPAKFPDDVARRTAAAAKKREAARRKEEGRLAKRSGIAKANKLHSLAKKSYLFNGVAGTDPEALCREAGLEATELNLLIVSDVLLTMSLEDSQPYPERPGLSDSVSEEVA